MIKERTLVLIKPDAMIKKLAGNIISELDRLDLKMVGLKLVNVSNELAKRHYAEHKEKPFFNDLIEHITGKIHNNENVIAIAYEGEDAIAKIRDLVGATHPDKALPSSIRGKFGKVHTLTNCHETVIHASDSVKSAEREISLWFSKQELVE